jgi:hypothetical protein
VGGVTGVSTQTFDLVGRFGNIPYKTLIATQPQYNSCATLSGTAWPPANSMCQFAYGWNNISIWDTNVTQPMSREIVQQTPVMMGNTAPPSIAASPLRGIINPQYWVMEKFIRTQGMEVPDFNDCDSLDPLDFWDQEMGLPIGSQQANATPTATTIIYGSNSVQDSANIFWNTGLHNQITTFFWAPIGYEDSNIDYGIYKGNMRMITTFGYTPSVKLNFFFLHYYLISFMMIGNGTCQTNIQLP